MSPLVEFVRRHEEPVRPGEFRVLAIALLSVAIAVASAWTYANLMNVTRVCASISTCEAWAAPSLRGPLQPPVSQDAMPWRLGAEKRSGRRS